MAKKVFITGISGFVGAGVARYFLGHGYEVHGLVRSTAPMWRLEDIKDKITLHIGDLLNKESIQRALQTAKPDIVLHLAVYGAYPSQKDADLILSTSLISTMHLLVVAKEVGVGVFVNTGSSSEYGTKDHPMNEADRIDPNSYYAIGKSAQTLLCQHFARQENFSVITLRLFSVYGPYEEPGRLVPTVALHALHDREINLADPSIARDFIYINDVAEAFRLASEHPSLSGEVVNIGSGVQHTLQDLADATMAITASKSRIVVGGYEKRSFDTHTWVSDTSKASSLLGFIPRYNLVQGLTESIAWFRQHEEYYKK